MNVEQYQIPLTPGEPYQYTKTGGVYELSAIGNLKFNGVWHDSVTYVNGKGEFFTRTIEDFIENFEHVKV
jgi:hypothetical protein